MGKVRTKTEVTGEVLSTNVEPANNGKVYPRVTFQGTGRFNQQVECVPQLADQVSKLKPGQVVKLSVYTKNIEIEVNLPNGKSFKKWVDYIDNANELEVVG